MVSSRDILKTPPYDGVEDIVEYAYRTNGFWFSDIIRLNGIPYLDDHLVPVSERSALMIRNQKDMPLTRVVGLSHDSEEQFPAIKSFDPYEPRPVLPRNGLIINDLFAKAGSLGEQISYGIYCMSRIGETYNPYIRNLYDFRSIKHRKKREAKMVACIVKISDASGNTKLKERVNIERAVEQYRNLKGRSVPEFRDFYSQKGIFSSAYFNGKMQSIDVDWFKNQMKGVVADFNSMREKRFKKNGVLLSEAEKNMLFDPIDDFYDPLIVRAALKQLMVETLGIYRKHTKESNFERVLRRSLRLKAPKGQILLAEEVLDDIVNWRIATLRSS